jgi:hypothetical protein
MDLDSTPNNFHNMRYIKTGYAVTCLSIKNVNKNTQEYISVHFTLQPLSRAPTEHRLHGARKRSSSGRQNYCRRFN